MIISNAEKLIGIQELAKVEVDETVRRACKVMCALDVGALVVMKGEILVGVLSERDVIRKCTCAGRHTSETLVSEIMTENG